MNTHKFIVLLPHRDSRLVLDDFRQRFFAAGFNGAYAFPPVAPLARVSQAYNGEELKALAQGLRRLSLLKDRKFTASQLSCPQAGIMEGTDFFGPLLDLPPLDGILVSDKVLFTFPRTVLCAALLGQVDGELLTLKLISNTKRSFVQAPDFQPFSFRAAMVTNLAIRPLKRGAAPYSFEWRLGPGCWLPKQVADNSDL